MNTKTPTQADRVKEAKRLINRLWNSKCMTEAERLACRERLTVLQTEYRADGAEAEIKTG